MTTPQREHWDGHPLELEDAWIMRKDDKVARCVLVPSAPVVDQTAYLQLT